MCKLFQEYGSLAKLFWFSLLLPVSRQLDCKPMLSHPILCFTFI